MRTLRLLPSSLVIACSIAAASVHETHAISPPVLMKERGGGEQSVIPPCAVDLNQTGSCANYRWYNICSGYLWAYLLDPTESVGTLFGGPSQPCVAPGNTVERVVTYFRGVSPHYGGVKVLLHRDNEGDGCPEDLLAGSGAFYPAERWNCSNFNTVIPAGVNHLIVRQFQDWIDAPIARGGADRRKRSDLYYVVTDGAYNTGCDPIGVPRSFYYGSGSNHPTACVPWDGPTARHDNFLTWLIVDSSPTSVESRSWGQIKGLYH